ncbi:MAG TPA: DUF1206 domain-containing protein, partial [Thermoanaerobaculia bacterium]|nr:DUF1206 domain-containing protein [Thermoanaerobaculia bacterium]
RLAGRADLSDRRPTAVRGLAFLSRLGDAARGLVYLAVGFLALRAAIAAHGGVAGPDGALRWVLREPHGALLVGLIAGGLFADALFRMIEATRRRSLAGRFSSAFRGAAAAAFGWTALSIERNARRSTGGPVLRRAAAWLLEHPWGARALLAAGAIAGIVALLEIGQGLTGRLRYRLRKNALGPGARRWAQAVSRIGLAAHGALVGAVAVWIVLAGLEANPRDVVDSGGALRRLERLPFGPGLLVALAAGLMAYGASQWILAIYRRD